MDTYKTDKFTEEEESLLNTLKLNCRDDGREIDLEISASIFHKLGTLYLRRSEICSTIDRMICLIRCAVLLNAALVRTGCDSNIIEQDLKQLNLHLLKSAEAEQPRVDLCKQTKMVKLLVQQMREHVNKILHKLSKVVDGKSEDERFHQEVIKIMAIERLQNKITADYTNIMAKLAEDCIQIMGKAPCRFVIVGMGSLARKEITPYSDFEHVIVLDSQIDSDNEEILYYFRWYSVIFQIILIHLGETIIPSLLNNTNSKLGSWFYDDVTKSGVCFDGAFPWASKYPLGRQQFTKDKHWKTELIKSVPDMLNYLNHEQNIKNGYHLSDILTKVCFVYGDESVFEEFQSGLNGILLKQNENLKHEVLKQIVDDLENFSIRSVLLKITNEGNYNVKKDVYRVTTLFIAALGRLNKISAFSCFDIIRQLAKDHVISRVTEHNLMYAIAIACEIRLRWYMANKRQKNIINGKDATLKFLEIIGETSAVSYFQTAYALQCDISKQFDLKKGPFYSHPKLLNVSIYSTFQNDKQVENCMKACKVNATEQRLLNFDDCLKMLTTKQTMLIQKQLPLATNTTIEQDLYDNFHILAENLLMINKFIDAKECLERALKIKQRILRDVATDVKVAVTLDKISQCLIEMNKLADAKDHLERALNIKQRISCDIATDREVAVTLHELGRCLINMNELADAKDHLERSLNIKQQISCDIATDREVAVTLHEIGRCLIEMNKLADAKDHLERSLDIKQRISCDIATDREVAVTLHELGQCLIDMNELVDAKDHLERSLDIKQRISCDIATDREVAATLHELGQCLIDMNELVDAKDHLERSLDIKQRISSDIVTDREVAATLHELGRCLIEMNKLADAKDHLERSLDITERISCDIATDRELAATLHVIGRCLVDMNELVHAKDHLERSLDITERISCDIATDRNMAVTLHELGRCLIGMNKLTDAKDHLERSLNIKQRISSDIATDREVAVTLHVLGRCLVDMNELVDAKDHLERSLDIKQRISHDPATDRELAVTLHVLGQCLVDMNELVDAKDHLERSLDITERISCDIATDRNMAVTLHVLGRCLVDLNKLADAKDHLERSLNIKQRISCDIATDREVAVTLYVLGRCLIDMNELVHAKDHLERSLDIKQQISCDIATDREVAVTLHVLGRCLIDMNELADAKDHLERSLDIKQRISCDIATDRELAATLHVLGQCLIDMNKLADAKDHLER